MTWTPTTDEELTSAETEALDALLATSQEFGDCSAHAASLDPDENLLQVVGIAHPIDDLTIGIIVRKDGQLIVALPPEGLPA